MEQTLRLDKYLADLGKGTRSQIRDMVRGGRVKVNGETAKKPEQKVKVPGDAVTLDGMPVAYVEMEYYLLNKPAGTVSATEDKRYPTVVSLIKDRNRRDLFPVGRLDLDTEGLLLITNNGDLAHRLLSPKRHVDKVYFARCQGMLLPGAEALFEAGISLPDGLTCLPAKLERLREYREEDGERVSAVTEVLLTIREGKFHQVKRMMEAVGCPVLYLKRLSMGPLQLDETLKPGEYRALTTEELERIKKL